MGFFEGYENGQFTVHECDKCNKHCIITLKNKDITFTVDDLNIHFNTKKYIQSTEIHEEKTYTKQQIKKAISNSYERNSFNDRYFWSNLIGEDYDQRPFS